MKFANQLRQVLSSLDMELQLSHLDDLFCTIEVLAGTIRQTTLSERENEVARDTLLGTLIRELVLEFDRMEFGDICALYDELKEDPVDEVMNKEAKTTSAFDTALFSLFTSPNAQEQYHVACAEVGLHYKAFGFHAAAVEALKQGIQCAREANDEERILYMTACKRRIEQKPFQHAQGTLACTSMFWAAQKQLELGDAPKHVLHLLDQALPNALDARSFRHLSSFFKMKCSTWNLYGSELLADCFRQLSEENNDQEAFVACMVYEKIAIQQQRAQDLLDAQLFTQALPLVLSAWSLAEQYSFKQLECKGMIQCSTIQVALKYPSRLNMPFILRFGNAEDQAHALCLLAEELLSSDPRAAMRYIEQSQKKRLTKRSCHLEACAYNALGLIEARDKAALRCISL